MTPTNSQCVNHGTGGYGCIALVNIDEGCLLGTCPFFKTEQRLKADEARARMLCEQKGYTFKSRADIIGDMDRSTIRMRSRYERMNSRFKPKKILQYNTVDNIYVEYEDIDHACALLDMPKEIIATNFCWILALKTNI